MKDKWNPRWPGTCACTKKVANNKKDKSGEAWIKFHLEKESYVDTVKLLNRADCCKRRIDGHEVWVGEHKCGTLYFANQAKDGWITVQCPWSALGNEIMVTLPKDGKGLPKKATDKAPYLQICGFEFTGE